MFNKLPLIWPRAVALLTGVCLLGTLGPAPRSAPFERDDDGVGSWNGRPLPRPDSPGEAMAFRLRQWRDEHGIYAANALVDAKAHVDQMRQRPVRGQMSPAAGVTNAGWTWLGPGNIGGRVRALVIDPTNVNVMLAGSAGGGIFKTVDGGISWAPVDDFMANLAVSTIVMKPGQPTTMFAGTGEGFYNFDGIRGAGVFTSTDGGTTWSQLAATANASWFYVNKLAMSPDGNVILAATRTGLFRSIDGGASWLNTQATELTGVVFHPTDSAKVIATGYAGNALFSIDGGASWTPATGLPGEGFTRVEAAYAKGSPTTVYASVDTNGGSIYKSTDGGATYTVVFNGAPDYLSNQGWYGNTIWVDPTNENSLVIGGVDLWKSTNGGASISQISNWASAPNSAHADHHAIVEQPGFNGSTNKSVFFTNDGGVYKTTNVYTVGGGTFPYTSGWTPLNNDLGITQFYGAGGHPATGVILGGTQDNGTLKYTPATGTTWTTEFGGDGGFSAVDQTNANHLFGEYIYLTLQRSLDGGTNTDYINGLFWDGSGWDCKPTPYTITDSCDNSKANFIAPFVLDPNDSNTLLAGGASLWRTNDASTPNTPSMGPTWANIKDPVGTGDNISAIGVAPTDSSQIWVGHNSGALYKTTTGLTASPAWVRMGAGTLPPRWVMRSRVDPSDANVIYVGYGGFSASNLWKSVDGGTTWFAASGAGLTALPAAPVRDIAVNPRAPSWLYAATEVGIFTSQDGGATWTVPHDGPANVSVEELFWMGANLVAVTHGRGLFKTVPAGLTWGTLTGHVRHATTAAAVIDASIDVYASGGQFVATAVTDASGFYAIEDLATGSYFARAGRPGFLTQLYENVSCVPGCNVTTQGTPIPVTAGSTTSHIDFALDGGNRIAGRVVNASGGAALAGVEVDLYNASGQWVTYGYTDASGNYMTSAGVPAGTYFARTVNWSGFVNELYAGIPCPNCSPTSGTPISLTAGTTIANINFVLTEGGRIGGVVTQSAGGSPIGNVEIDVYNSSGQWVDYAYSNASGNYLTLQALPSGSYFAVTWNNQGYINESYDNIACFECLVTSGSAISVTAGTTTSNINFALDAGGRIAGTVTHTATAAPIANVSVNIYNASGRSVASGFTDESGHYESGTGLPSGTYYGRTVNSHGLINEVYNNTVCLNCNVTTGTPIAVTAGVTTDSINFALAEGGRITGTVLSPPANPASGYLQVDIYNGAGSHVASAHVPAAPLNYTVAQGLPAGTYYARTSNSRGLLDQLYDNIACITPAGGVCNTSAGMPISVVVGATTSNIDFDLAPGGRIAGTVSSTGAPLGNITVQIYSAIGVLLDSPLTGNAGNYRSGSGLPGGTYHARTFNSSGFGDKLYNNITCVSCVVTSGTPVPVDIGTTTSNIDFALSAVPTIALSATTLAPGGMVMATIANGPGNAGDWVGLFATGAPPSAYVHWQYLNGMQTAPAVGLTGATLTLTLPQTPGTYELRFFQNNTYTLLATSVSITVVAASVIPSVTTGGAGAPVTVTIANGPGYSGDWVALASTGAPATSFVQWQYLNGTHTAPATGLTGAALTFTLPQTPGTYELRFFQNNTFTVVATSVPITVAAATVTPIVTTGGPGAPVTVTIANGPGRPTDWVALAATGAPATTFLQFQYLNGTRTPPATGLAGAMLTFALPQTPGTYELRFFQNNTFTLLATSVPITVVAASVTPSATTGGPGAPVMVTIGNGPGRPTDWVALFATGAPATAFLQWQYLNGTHTAPTAGLTGAMLTFTLPQTLGTYELRFFQNNTFTVLATSAPMTVAAPSVTPSLTMAGPGAPVTATIANGPGNRADWVGLFATGAPGTAFLQWQYLNGTHAVPAVGLTGAMLTFTLPQTPGTYELRFFQNDTLIVLATSATITVQ